MSISNLEGIAIFPLLLLSTFIEETIVVSKSLEVIVRFELSISNRKWSKTGIVLVALITPLSTCNFFNRAALETMNFIEKY